MTRENAAWLAVGFVAAILLTGAAAAPPADQGRWQLLLDYPASEAVIFDTATGALWALPKNMETPVEPERVKRARNSWFEFGPVR